MNIDIIRAWKDRSYRESLSEEEQALLENPVGQIELTDEQLKEISGALDQRGNRSWNWCGGGRSWNWCGGGRSWNWCGGRSWNWCGGGHSWNWCGGCKWC